MNRNDMLERLAERREPWDVIVIGGGATGAGIAVDAATRGYATVLVEQSDFGKGTSSRSTKLIHGGVRYLRQGNLALVRESLRERERLRANAPHLVRPLAFLIPAASWREGAWYATGLKAYDWLAGRDAFPASQWLGRDDARRRLPTVRAERLRGGVLYWDGQFDDARLVLGLVRTAVNHGAAVLNYARCTSLVRDAAGQVAGVALADVETGEELEVPGRAVINATGPLADQVRRLDNPGATPLITPSQGIHLVLGGTFLPEPCALMVPRTRDGRVMFAIPWKGRTLIGTTDEPVREASLEPVATEREIDFLLETAREYFSAAPDRSHIKSVFAGIRPLVRATEGTPTSSIARDHTIETSRSGLVTICGGKWTTYRKMAEDCVGQAATVAGLDARPCRTATTRIHGYTESSSDSDPLSVYGSDAADIAELGRQNPAWGRLDDDVPITAAEVIWAARREMARTVEDVLSRRTRTLVLDARAAARIAPQVARHLAAELERPAAWADAQVAEFRQLAAAYGG